MTVEITQTCLVTGANGFIASHIIEKLLKRGYKVRGTVRSLENKAKYAHLVEFENARDNLSLVEADILDKKAINEATRDIDICFHVASPFTFLAKDPKKDLWEPAVNGTLNVLECCQRNGVKQVILTSSFAAVSDCPKDNTLTEEHWNQESSLKRNPYFYSKAQSEGAAWRYYETLENPSFKLVSILPFATVGRSHTSVINASADGILKTMTGEMPLLDASASLVDVEDVAEAHILAAENPKSNGRYIVTNQGIPSAELNAILKKNFPSYDISQKMAPTWMLKLVSYLLPAGQGSFIRTNIGAGQWKISTEKLERDLGLKLKSNEECAIAAVNDFIKWGHLPVK
ncbi:hypothetical protein MP638_003245 [Amoeboaphelidium occidentale]|nr:hypothetical protein MP638_003245 [Amoeboaphelidium occidentale]